MKINTYGNRENEAILLLHPMFTSADFFDFVIDKLSKDYYLIIPTYSGHYENSTYISMQEEENAIDSFLQENSIKKLKAIIGFSLGGNIAFHYFCQHRNDIDKVIIDSAPIFKFPAFVKNHFYKKYRKCLLNIKENPQNTVDELNKCFNGMGKYQQFTAPIVTLDSLKNLIESCYNVETPKLDLNSEKKMTFIYGGKDIARLCLPRIKKYKNSQIIKIDKSGHCSYFMTKTDEYIARLLNA